MAMYLVLYKYTEQGAKTIKESPARIRETIQRAEAAGLKVHGVYLAMGEYDLVALTEAPTDEAGMTFLLAQAAQGNVHSTTMKLFPLESFEQMVARIP